MPYLIRVKGWKFFWTCPLTIHVLYLANEIKICVLTVSQGKFSWKLFMMWILEHLLDVIILGAFNRSGRGHNSLDDHEKHNTIDLWKRNSMLNWIHISCNQAIELLKRLKEHYEQHSAKQIKTTRFTWIYVNENHRHLLVNTGNLISLRNARVIETYL